MNNDRYQDSLFDDNLEYDAFKDKFVPKLTTDDCYTPGPIYDAVASYVSSKYCISKDFFIRPFFPDSDYMDFDYPEGSVVVDNPPFSIISQIAKYKEKYGCTCLWVRADNNRAIHVYEKLGFVKQNPTMYLMEIPTVSQQTRKRRRL